MNTIASKSQMINTKGLKLPQKRSLNLPRRSDDLSAKWFYIDADGKECGPFSVNAIRKLIKPDTYVWREGLAEWVYAAETKLLKSRSASKVQQRTDAASNISLNEPEKVKSLLRLLITIAFWGALGYGAVCVRDYVTGIVNEVEEDMAINNGTADQGMFDKKRAVTPKSFCGVEFGENIEVRFPDAKKIDNSKARKSEYSYWKAAFSLGTPFRNFKNGQVYASMFSKKIYKVELNYKFPRGVTEAVDAAEYRGTLDALCKKYKVGNVEDESLFGDKVHKFKVGNVLITLKYTTEGLIDDGQLELTAENLEYKNLAVAECERYYQERSRMDVENMKSFQNGGIDNL